jgi:hypothetical protein
MQLIIKPFTTLLMAFSGMTQTTKFCHRALRYHDRKCTSQLNQVRYHFGVFIISLVRRIIINLLNSSGMSAINLYQLYATSLQKMRQWFCVRPRRFKTKNNFMQFVSALHPTNVTPELLKTFTTIGEFYWGKLCTIRTTTITDIPRLSKINCSYQGLRVDYAFTFT